MKVPSDTTNLITVESDLDVATGSDAEVVLAAVAGEHYEIDFISAGYQAAPDAGSCVLIVDVTNTATIFQVPVTAAGPAFWQFGDGGFPCPTSSAITIRLEDGSQTKDLVVKYR